MAEQENAEDVAQNSAPTADYDSYEKIMATEQGDDIGPLYRVIGNTRIATSKHRGKLWKTRKEQGLTATRDLRKSWDENIKYYKHDQSTRIESDSDVKKPRKETENMVFTNVTVLVSMLYTKNPDCEFTPSNEETKPLALALDKLIGKLANMKAAPGLNIKRKSKKAVALTSLCNLAWFEVGYTLKPHSADAAVTDLERISEELQNAKNVKDIKRLEGELMALEEKVDTLSPSGPFVKLKMPWQVIVDDTATDLDLSDANWVMIEDMLKTSYLKAVYGKPREDNPETYDSIFSPTHVLKVGKPEAESDISPQSFSLFDKTSTFKQYGYESEESFKSGQVTKVYYVWDKVTRRVELYSDGCWDYPIWVWDDPYNFDQFFPLVPLDFHSDPTDKYAKGEVTYYLDQQDALNNVNEEFARIRRQAQEMVAYNKRAIKDPELIDRYINGSADSRAVGFEVPEGMSLKDVFQPLLPVSAQVAQFFDKRPILETIDRLSGVSSVQRGVEYKTNTTNRAIESYESQIQTRADEKMDSIEECLGRVYWLVAQVCLQFMDKEAVAAIIGEQAAEPWRNMSPQEIRLMFVPRVLGGSSLKPTSAGKKQQAMQLMQILGQFASSTPIAGLIALQVMKTAYANEMVIDDNQWAMIEEFFVKQLQAPQQGEQPTQPSRSAPPSGQSSAPASGGGGGMEIEGLLSMVQEAGTMLDSLPPEIKEAIGIMLARNTPVEDIVANIIGRVQGTMQ
jgi:hypothetical protein